MTKGVSLMIYGVALFICGVAAYLANPLYPLLLISSAVAGGLMAGFGVIFLKGAPTMIQTITTMLTLIFMMFGLALAMNYGLKVIKESTSQKETVVSAGIFAASAAALWRLKKKD